jgi:uncharacterized protein YbbC (DUF1343 family)
MIGVENARDVSTGAPIHSLYGDSFASLSPKREWLEGLDLVVVDLQDVGSRYYTFVWTAVLVLRACAAAGIDTLVLDRPNPLGGLRVEGAPQKRELCSFVGLRPVPVRHGLTIAEIVRDAANDEKLGGLHVLAMQGWSRSMYFDETGLPWVYPSPNMPTVETAVVYPGGCLLEATRASEGRGTTRPFEVFGAPWVDGFALAKAMESEGGAGFRARPLTFLPTFQKHARAMCGGVQVHVTDRAKFEPYRAYLAAVRAMHPMRGFEWRRETYEFVDEHAAMDLLTGDGRVREAIEAGESVDAMLAVGAERLRAWDPRSRWIYD